MAEQKRHICLKETSWDKTLERLSQLERIQAVQQEQINNQGKLVEGINKLSENVLLLNNSVTQMKTDLKDVAGKVDHMEKTPGKQYTRYKEHVVYVLIGAGVMYLLSTIF